MIANMGAELGATSSVFPSDREVKRFLESEGRGADWQSLAADEGSDYDHKDRVDLDGLEPLIAKPSSPGNVVPVQDVVGESIFQAYIGSSANPGFRDFAIAAGMVQGRQVADGVSFDNNPTSRQLLQRLIRSGDLERLVASDARLHQAGCNGCIGMVQAPATEQNSLRTVFAPRPAIFRAVPVHRKTGSGSAVLRARARDLKEQGGHAIVAGSNYGQGSSCEHAAIAPRFLGLRLVVAKSFARIHWQNLINYGVLPMMFVDDWDDDRLQQDVTMHFSQLRSLAPGRPVEARLDDGSTIRLEHRLSRRQCELVLAGGDGQLAEKAEVLKVPQSLAPRRILQ